ncbi:MAG: HTH-type transcriptional regulator hmrR [Pseudonocardiales bacterium]|nr:HTH-type transcriptional regulator hmrR [Pseudonocardiales bacterium]
MDDRSKTFVLDAEGERALGKSLFNGVWTLMEQDDRTPDDDDRMLNMAHASRYHWGQAPLPATLARGEWLCSRVYAVLGRAEPAQYHGQRMLDICSRDGIRDWDLAFAYEALARASAVAGDAAGARAFTEQALAAAEDIAEDDDRELLLGDLESIPGQPRFW